MAYMVVFNDSGPEHKVVTENLLRAIDDCAPAMALDCVAIALASKLQRSSPQFVEEVMNRLRDKTLNAHAGYSMDTLEVDGNG